MMGTWWKRCDRQTDGQTGNTICRAAWSQLKMIGHLFYTHSSFMHHTIAIGGFGLQSGNTQIGSNLTIFAPCVIEISRMALKNNTAPLLYPFKLYASFHSHWWVYVWVTVRKHSNWVKFDDFFAFCILDILRMTLKNNTAPLLSNIKLCASFHHHIWIQTGVTVRKWLNWVLTSVTLTFDLDLLHWCHFCHW